MKSIKSIISKLYVSLGRLINQLLIIFLNRKEKKWGNLARGSIVFVAHPDDETLFFYSVLKKEHPYIVCLTTGWSLRRMIQFSKAMKYYDLQWRAYATWPKNMKEESIRKKEITEAVKYCLSGKIGNFNKIYTHNAIGEYSNQVHRLVNKVVRNIAIEPVYVPAKELEIVNYPLTKAEIAEKKKIISSYYCSEIYIIDEYPVWMNNEHTELIMGNCL